MFSGHQLVKSKLSSNQITLGAWITLAHTAIAEIYSNSGYDWVVVDLEHSMIDYAQASELIRTIDLCNSCPLVRLSSTDSVQIKRVMDAGAHGIIVPNIKTADEARHAVRSTRYAPDGTRGVGLARAQKYGSAFKDYLQWQVNSPIVIVQIEHISAVSVLDEILSVPNIDAFFIGPYDLSCSMGIPGEFDHPEFIEVMAKIRNIGQTCKCPSGIHIVEPDITLLQKHIDLGYKFIAYSVDIRMLDSSSRLATKLLDSLS